MMTKSPSAAPKNASRNPLFRAVYRWLDERLGLNDLTSLASKKTVPEHKHSLWYVWGGLTLFFFIVMCFTGVLLMLYYRPGNEAYESVRQINSQIKFGWLIRSIHAWSANLMIASALVHMFSVFFMKAYRSPREFTWLSGLGLLGLSLVFGFSGYLLPMDVLSFFATQVGLSIPAAVPVVGPWFANLVRGGLEINAFTVSRFFALHVVVLPALFTALLLVHLVLIQKHGISIPESEEANPVSKRRSIPFFPNFAMKDLGLWLVALNVLAVLAALFPWDLGEPADPIMPTPLNIHPEWYFMSSFQVLKIIGKIIPGVAGELFGLVFFNLGLVLWALIPFYDVKNKAARRARLSSFFGLLVLILLIVTTIWGYAAVGQP